MIIAVTSEREMMSNLIEQRTGLYYPSSRWGELEKAISDVFTHESPLRLSDLLPLFEHEKDGDEKFNKLIERLTIGETYFFREKPLLDVFTHEFIPQIIRDKVTDEKSLNIWSAGCCTGEEPYTLAMLIRENLPDAENWNIRIRGCDINTRFIEKAKAGRYSDWSFRETSPALRDKYFRQEGKSSAISGDLKRMVEFSVFSLANKDYTRSGFAPESVHAIFCRNVLMYLSAATWKHSLSEFFRLLVPGGWLFLSSVELPVLDPAPFTLVKARGVNVLRKINKEDPTPDGIQAVSPGLATSLSRTGRTLRSKRKPLTADSKNSKSSEFKEPGSTSAVKEEIFKEALSLHRNKASDRELIIKKAFDENRFHEVIALAGESAAGEWEEETTLIIARSHANCGNLDESIKLLEQLQSIATGNAGYIFLQASVMLEKNLPGDAEVLLRRSLYLEPDLAAANLSMGNLMMQKGEAKLATRYYKNVLKILENEPDEAVLPLTGDMTAGYVRKLISPLIHRNSDGRKR